ncbi:3-oxoacyl-ACP reductase [Caulobacter sp. D4A]|uniref:3-oxoacyl-ACP reductase n=1 Tax=unclassified Caulobacter TaxID=2648921 RepID=UPI000D736E4E|nr:MULTISPECIES: 3-oxoacyl-ACP reductase [unclassified Caulobacter]PXA84030.1 3-oxoacyl-ACP reductase [Caulobacter sp. D4A]PXA94258.1 3-oxoacyl-ACP reductase [Caulobacter sp. D5]
MPDRYLEFASSGLGGWVVEALGLPKPAPLLRRGEGEAPPSLPLLLGPPTADGRMGPVLMRLAAGSGVEIHHAWTPDVRYGGLVFDASACLDVAATQGLYRFFHQAIRSVAEHGRIVVVGIPPETAKTAEGEAIQRGLEGFVRSLAKEARRSIAVQLLYVTPGREDQAQSTLAFLLSPRSAYVSGQVIRVGAAAVAADPAVGHAGRQVLVTGAARGIGEAIVRLFVAEGAKVTALDVPSAQDDLRALAQELGVDPLALDITAPEAAGVLLKTARARGGFDVVVHNAGITRDRTLGRMDEREWNSVMAVNLGAPLALTRVLLEAGAVRRNGRIVAVSSLSGVAGNMGQTNYALSKAGWIGAVGRMARDGLDHGITVNAVAPGFIETRMTAAIPFAIREAGRRMNSMGQGGSPVDVAETIAWLAHPASGGVNGQVVRVCGQSLLGA